MENRFNEQSNRLHAYRPIKKKQEKIRNFSAAVRSPHDSNIHRHLCIITQKTTMSAILAALYKVLPYDGGNQPAFTVGSDILLRR